jgi:hypothetical protein
MKEFVLLFRMDILSKDIQPSPEQLKIYMKQWNEWVEWFSKKGQLTGGNHMSANGRVLKPENKIEEGPHISEKLSVAGYLTIKAKDMDEATTVAMKCPILEGENTSVEVREIEQPG